MNDLDLKNEGMPTDFRLKLQQVFVNRCRKNAQYSLRAFARSLGIEPSPLSEILRGKRPLTVKMKHRLGLALGMKLQDIQRFNLEKKKSAPIEFQQITLDVYSIISDWYHYAILELIKTKNFKAEDTYIARTLGISKTEVQIAAERLQRVGLLEISKNGKWVDTSFDCHATNISDELTSFASKKLQKQILEKSIQALEEVPILLRNHTSMTFAIHPDDLPEAKEKIKKFRRDLCIFFEKNRGPTEIYHLGISLYPVTKLGG